MGGGKTTPEAVAAALDWNGVVSEPMRLLDREVHVVLELSPGELRRRSHTELGAFTDRRTLDILLNVPRREPWSTTDAEAQLSSKTLRFLVERGAMALTPNGYRRILAPIGKVAGVLAATGTWQAQTEAVSRFAAYAPRAIVVDSRPRTISATCGEARTLGIGVVAEAETPKVLVSPSEAASRWSAWHWTLAEWAYSRLRSQLGKESKQDIGYSEIVASAMR